MFIRDPGYREQLVRWGLDTVAGACAFPAQIGPPPELPTWRRVADGSTTSCYRLADGDVPPRRHTLYLKHYRYSPPNWRYMFRASRAQGECDNLRLLSELGIHCPQVVALGEQRRIGRLLVVPLLVGVALLLAGLAILGVGQLIRVSGLLDAVVGGSKLLGSLLEGLGDIGGRMIGGGATTAGTAAVLAVVLRLRGRDSLAAAALIVTAIEPSEDLERFARGRWRSPFGGDPVQRAQIDRLARQLAVQVAVCHRARFVHGDLKFRNLLVWWPPGGEPGVENLRLAWVDCPRGRRAPAGPLWRHGQIRDLAGLDRNAARFATRAQRLRFLTDYLTALGGPQDSATVRRLARRIAAYHRRHPRPPAELRDPAEPATADDAPPADPDRPQRQEAS